VKQKQIKEIKSYGNHQEELKYELTENEKLYEDRLFAFERLVNVLANSLDTALPLSYVKVFLMVARKEGLGPTEYSKMYGTSQPMMSRYLIELSVRGRNTIRKSGLGLVERVEDPSDFRAQLYYLTPKGRRILNECLVYISSREERT
jgi:DNA-binding MarR family transcriptional regulator